VLAFATKDVNDAWWLGLVVGILVAPLLPFTGFVATVATATLFALFGYTFPSAGLASRASKRQKAIRKAMPDTMDLLTISVEAGLGFDAALAQVVKNVPGPLSEEIARMLQEMQIGVSRTEALSCAIAEGAGQPRTTGSTSTSMDVSGRTSGGSRRMIGRAILPSPPGHGGDLRGRVRDRHDQQERTDGAAKGAFADAERDARSDPGPGDHAEGKDQEDRPVDVPE